MRGTPGYVHASHMAMQRMAAGCSDFAACMREWEELRTCKDLHERDDAGTVCAPLTALKQGHTRAYFSVVQRRRLQGKRHSPSGSRSPAPSQLANSATMALPDSLSLASLRTAYAGGKLTPTALLSGLYQSLNAAEGVFLYLAALDSLMQRCAELEAQPEAERGAFWGVPFSAKDNVDVAGMPTTAACPAFSYTPDKSNAVVEALISAGESSALLRQPHTAGRACGRGSSPHVGRALPWPLIRAPRGWLAGKPLYPTATLTPFVAQVLSAWGRPTWISLRQAWWAPARRGSRRPRPSTAASSAAAPPQVHRTQAAPQILSCVHSRPSWPPTQKALEQNTVVWDPPPLGSAAAVGARLVSFALGTDTAGSGRVPAGLCGCVGVKPTVGSVTTVGETWLGVNLNRESESES
jgi:hypothetical protein